MVEVMPTDPVTLSGLLATLFLCLSLLFALLRRPHKTFHRYFAHLTWLTAVVHVALVLYPDLRALDSLTAAEVSGLIAIGGLMVTALSAFRRAPRRCRAATTESRARAARAGSARHPNASRILHLLPGVVTVFALTAHVIIIQDTTAHRWLWIVLCEGIALVMIGRYVIPNPFRRRSRGKPRHRAPSGNRETTVLHTTAPVLVRPEKRVVHYEKIGITTPAQIPECLTYSPHSLFVAMHDKQDLLTYRRELALAGGRARYVRSLDQLHGLLPQGEDRTISEYVICGDPLFLAAVHEFLKNSGVPHSRIHVETTGDPVLPADHPSARIGRVRSNAFQ